MMNPYQNNSYYGYNPYMMQPQQPVIPNITGRIVTDESSITVGDVPMDKGIGFFPKQDLSEIYVKNWDGNGMLNTTVYKPVLQSNPNNLSNETEKLKIDLSEDVREVFEDRFNSLERKIDELVKVTDKLKPKTTTRARKESET